MKNKTKFLDDNNKVKVSVIRYNIDKVPTLIFGPVDTTKGNISFIRVPENHDGFNYELSVVKNNLQQNSEVNTLFLNDFIKELKYLLETVSYDNYDSTIDIINELFNIQCLLTFSQFSRTYGFKFYYVRNDETVCNNNFTRKIEENDEAKKDMLLEVFKFIIDNKIKPDVRYNKNYNFIGDFNEHEYERHLEYYLSNAIECLSVI